MAFTQHHPAPHAEPAALPAGMRHLVDTTMFWSTTGGGVARYLRDKRRWAAAHGRWRHTLVVPGHCEAPDRAIGGIPIPASGGYRFPLDRRRAARLLAELQPDVIEAGDPFCLAHAALDAGQQCGVPVAAFCHSNVVAEAGRRAGAPGRLAMQRYLRRVLREFDVVFAASRWMVDEARDLGLDNVVHQPLGVDLELFNPARRDARWRDRLGIADDCLVLIYVGRFAREKNLQVLVDAVNQLGSDVLLVAQGAGPFPPQGSRVRVLPYDASADAVATSLASADIFVHAGTRETFGLAPLEALACGTPVVLPARAGFLDLIDGQAALGVADATPTEIAAGVRALQSQGAGALRARAREAAQAFDQRQAFARLFARYVALCGASAQANSSLGGLRLA
jgi:alpha-1,6-mannosyltransferase